MGRPRTFSETEALDAICASFWDQGYCATSLDDLTEATGLGKGSLYAAFGSKHDMFVQGLRLYCERMVAMATSFLHAPSGSALQRLEKYVQHLTREMQSPRGCLLSKAAAELGRQDDEVNAIISKTFEELGDQLVAAVRQAQREGDVPARLDARRSGLMLLAVIRGMEAMARGGTNGRSLGMIAQGALAPLRADT
ncbi:TetR/AcrR family transcriptional regulator [bacterium]|nr:MAG: TetR/AcrR family transcriptional regulator [bacterium]